MALWKIDANVHTTFMDEESGPFGGLLLIQKAGSWPLPLPTPWYGYGHRR